MRFTRQYLRCVAVAIAFGSFSLFGCREGADNSDEPLNWKQAEAILESPDVETMHGVFVRLSKEPVRPKTKEFYADVGARLTEFESLDAYIAQFYQETVDYDAAEESGLDMSLDAIRERVAAEVVWKKPGVSLDDATRVYRLQTSQPTALQEIAAWGNLTYFEIFTDDRGTLLGWQKID